MPLKIRHRARRAAEQALASHAGAVRRMLLWMGRERAPHLPEIVQIESTNICNAKCTFCPRDDMFRRQGVMDMGLFKKIVDECAALGIGHVRVHNFGEPFVDRTLAEKIRYAKTRGIANVGLISNGSLLSAAQSQAILDAGLDAINISVDAAGRESFERTRVGLRYDTVIRNIEQLVALKRAAGAVHPKLILSFVRQNNSDEERAFVERWGAIADKIHVTDLHNWAGTLPARPPTPFPCYRPWMTFTVLWDGRVALCCADFDGKQIIGDMNTSTLEEVWNGEAYRRVRREHLDGGGPAICRDCDLPRKDSPLWVGKLL